MRAEPKPLRSSLVEKIQSDTAARSAADRRAPSASAPTPSACERQQPCSSHAFGCRELGHVTRPARTRAEGRRVDLANLVLGCPRSEPSLWSTGGAALWVPRTRTRHATGRYSCTRPPRQSRRSGRTVAAEGGGVRPAGTTGAVLDHDEQVEAAEEDGVDVGEVDREDHVGLGGEELSPGRAGPLRGGDDAGVPEDFSHGGAGDVVAESEELALDASVAPAWILSGHSQHQGTDRLRNGWPAGRRLGRSSGGRRGGRASAAGFWARRAVAGAAAWATVWSAR